MTLTAKRPRSESAPRHQNALAKSAIEAIEQIERETQQKKLAQVDSLQTAKANINMRIAELQYQLEQIEQAIASIKGTPVRKERRERRDLSGERERVARWMEGRRGQKFAARDLLREFPELDGAPISIFLKPLIEEGKIKTDASEGPKRLKYFVGG